MKKQFAISFLLIWLLSASLHSQSLKKDNDPQERLQEHVQFLASDKLEGRRTGEPGAAAAASYISNQFAKLGLKPGSRLGTGKASFLQEFPYTRVNSPTVLGYNVVGILKGRDKRLADEAIVIGAHYDHLGHGGEGSLSTGSASVHYGADDNASGTAAMLEIARVLAKEKKNERTIIFIAFSGEEEGLFGSKFYVNNPVFPIENTVAMINLDMVGRLSDKKLTIGGIGTATQWKAAVERQNSFTLQLNEDGFGPSDHSSFYTKKIPVLFFFTGTHLDYHKPSDTADKINYPGLVSIVDYVSGLVRTIDDDPVRPTYLVAKSSGTTGGRTGFNISLGTIPSYTESTDGMVVDGVRDDSPASRAGIKGNDKIVRLAGKDIKNVQDYTKALGDMSAGQEYEVVVLRGSERLTLKITPVKRP
jgi:hypothetical protein